MNISSVEAAVLVSIVFNEYGAADVSIPKWAHNESRKPHRFPHQKAGGAIRTLTSKGMIAPGHDQGTIHLTHDGITHGVGAYLDTVSPALQALAFRVIATVGAEITDPAAWFRRHGRDAAKRAVDEFIDGDIYYFPDLLYVVEQQIKSYMHERATAMADMSDMADAEVRA